MLAQRAPQLLLPLYEALSGRRPRAALDRLRRLQWQSPEAVEAHALTRLRPLLAHCAAHVPHYRELFSSVGLNPESIKTIADLERLPITTKRDLVAGFPDRFVAPNLPAARRWERATSGSTGLSIMLYLDRADLDGWLGSYLFFTEWAGVAPSDTMVGIQGLLRFDFDRTLSGKLVQWARERLVGSLRVHLVGTDLSASGLADAVRRLAGRRYFILAQASSAARLAHELLATRTTLASDPVAVVIGGETLTAVDVAAIEQAFRRRPVNHYSCWELVHLAQSCPDYPELLHVNSDRAIVRIVDGEGRTLPPGQEGRVVLTSLVNWVMPLINYDLNDWATSGPPCPCGRGLPTLHGLIGRQVELIRTLDGRQIGPSAVSHYMPTRTLFPHVAEYQLVQTAPEVVVLRLVPNATFRNEIGERIRRGLADGLGPGMDVRLEIVDSIALEPSGKRLVIKSLLPPERQAAR